MGSISRIALSVGAVTASALFLQPYRPVIVRGESMAPTLQDGQLIFSTKLNRTPKVGDVVIVEKDGGTIIKRVGMAPGDPYLEVRPKYAFDWSLATTSRWKQLARNGQVQSRINHVPEGYVYLLGDNPNHSLDSRVFGFVPVSSIRGIVADF